MLDIGGRVAGPLRHRREGRIVVVVAVVAALREVRALTIVVDRSRTVVESSTARGDNGRRATSSRTRGGPDMLDDANEGAASSYASSYTSSSPSSSSSPS